MAAWGHTQKKTTRTRSKSAHERFRRRMLFRRLVFFTFLALIGTAIWYGVRLPAFTLQTVTVSGGDTLNTNDIEQRVLTLLDGTYALFIPRRFVYMYPHEEIEKAIRGMPRVDRAYIERVSNNELKISVTEHAPHALWCAESTEAASSGCLFVSRDGFAFAEAPALTGSTFLRYVTEGRMPEIGVPFISVEYLRLTEEFSEALLLQYGMDVYAIYETKEGDVRYRIRGGGELLVPRVADIQKIFENLNSVLTSEEFKHIRPGNFNYIDLRFGNKIFVKQPVAGEETGEKDVELMDAESTE